MARRVIIPTIRGLCHDVPTALVDNLLWRPVLTGEGIRAEFLRLSDMEVSDAMFESVTKQ